MLGVFGVRNTAAKLLVLLLTFVALSSTKNNVFSLIIVRSSSRRRNVWNTSLQPSPSWSPFPGPSVRARVATATKLNLTKAQQSIKTQKIEKGLLRKGEYNYIIGCDESGRGSIAGPVVAVSICCIIDMNNKQEFKPIDGVDDSKSLSKEQREEIFEQIMEQSPSVYEYAISERSNDDIDDDASNIVSVTMDAFKESIGDLINKSNTLIPSETYCIVDGPKTPKLDDLYFENHRDFEGRIPVRPFIKGDSNVYIVALASIIAKVTRDRIMTKYHDTYPNYKFENNGGYPTREHNEAIHIHGISPVHRKSFKPNKGR